MTDNIKPDTAAWDHRRVVWKHNSFFGYAKMIQAHCGVIINSSTATPEAKRLADDIDTLAARLTIALKTRKDK